VDENIQEAPVLVEWRLWNRGQEVPGAGRGGGRIRRNIQEGTRNSSRVEVVRTERSRGVQCWSRGRKIRREHPGRAPVLVEVEVVEQRKVQEVPVVEGWYVHLRLKGHSERRHLSFAFVYFRLLSFTSIVVGGGGIVVHRC
jgi:hypothetical protein